MDISYLWENDSNMFRSTLLFCILFFLVSCKPDIVVDESWVKENYEKREVMIPMRDGKHLHTTIYQPSESKDRPILMVRTPYSCAPYGDGFRDELWNKMEEYVRNSYIIVYQDVRGRFMSEGEYVNVRPFNPYKSGSETDESSDTYDSIEWLLKNTDNNGAVGVTGMSYPGFYATMAALSGHPALKAVSPQAPILDWFKGDDVHHNGALMLLDIYSFATYMFKEHDNPCKEDKGLKSPIGNDAYAWFLDKKTPSAFTEALPADLQFWNEILEHPDYDHYWQDRSLESHLKDIRPAVLVVGGEYDTDDCYGALNTYRLIKENSQQTDLHFVYGPWYHGSWQNKDFKGLGPWHLGAGAAEYFLKKIEYPFFRHYLEGRGKAPAPVSVYPSGSDSWITMKEWPAELVEYKPIYLREDRILSFEKPVLEKSYSSYVSDPGSPVPFKDNPSKRNKNYMIADQRFASSREDILTFTGDTLASPLLLAGPVKADIALSLSTDDADIVVKLIDVYPDGYQMLVRGDVFPVRYRNSFTEPTPAVPGEMMRLEFTMNDVAHLFKPGHRLMVQIQSSWFPLVNMNPQTYLENIYDAVPKDYRSAEVKVFHENSNQSKLILPVYQQE